MPNKGVQANICFNIETESLSSSDDLSADLSTDLAEQGFARKTLCERAQKSVRRALGVDRSEFRECTQHAIQVVFGICVLAFVAYHQFFVKN